MKAGWHTKPRRAKTGSAHETGKFVKPIAEDTDDTEDAVAKVTGNASRLLRSAAGGTELQPNTAPTFAPIR